MADRPDIVVIGYQIPIKVETFDPDTNNLGTTPPPPGGYWDPKGEILGIFFFEIFLIS